MKVLSVLARSLRAAAVGGLPSLVLWGSLLAGSSAQAATYTWTKFGNGSYNDPNNWFPGGTPGANDFVSFELGWGNPYTVFFPGADLVNSPGGGGGSGGGPVSYAAKYLRIRDNGVTFSGSTQPFKTTSTLKITSTSETEANRGLIIGTSAGENASLSLSTASVFGGGLSSVTSVAATLGDVAGSAGTLNVRTGAFNVTGSDFTQTQLIIGNHGTGALNVTSGGDVNVLGFNSRTSLAHNFDSVGHVKISGAGSTWTSSNELWIGEKGEGSVTVENGGTLVTDGTGGTDSTILGTFKNGRGEVLVTGPGSTWIANSRLTVGNTGDGSLTIANGGKLINVGTDFTSAFAGIGLGSDSFGVATVTGPGSIWSTAGRIQVGSTGDGALAIINGGVVTSGSALIRGLNNGSGEVLVTGPGSTWNVTESALTIGMPEGGFTTGPTSLTIGSGALVNVAHEIDLDTNGVLKLQGGTLAVDWIGSNDLLSLHSEGAFHWTAGTLHAGTVFDSVTNQAGKLAPGRVAAGRTTIDGNYTQQAAATMAIEIGGATPETQYDFVSLEGSALLGGVLELSMINNFAPLATQTFAILNSLNPISGAFSNAANGQRLPTSDGIGSFLVHYGVSSLFDSSQIVLSDFMAAVPGDVDFDGDADADDLAMIEDKFGTANTAGYGDGAVDGSDILDWQRGQGGQQAAAASQPSIAAAPEPTSLTLVAIVAGGVAGFVRRERRGGR